MFFAPAGRIINPHFTYFLRKVIANRHRQPLPILCGFNPISVLPFIFLILNIIQIAKNIRPSYFVKITDPGQILRLMNGNDQFDLSLKVVLFLDLGGLYNDKITIEALQILEIKARLYFKNLERLT